MVGAGWLSVGWRVSFFVCFFALSIGGSTPGYRISIQCIEFRYKFIRTSGGDCGRSTSKQKNPSIARACPRVALSSALVERGDPTPFFPRKKRRPWDAARALATRNAIRYKIRYKCAAPLRSVASYERAAKCAQVREKPPLSLLDSARGRSARTRPSHRCYLRWRGRARKSHADHARSRARVQPRHRPPTKSPRSRRR